MSNFAAILYQHFCLGYEPFNVLAMLTVLEHDEVALQIA